VRKKLLFAAALLGVVTILLLDRLFPESLPISPRADAIIAGVTVINPGVERFPDYSIVVRDGRILELRPRQARDPEPICEGCYALPGLIDAHVHTPPRIALGNQALFALLYLAHGITTVRDLGASDGSVATLAGRLNDAELIGPRMLRCGPVLDGDPPSWPMATVITNPEDGATAVDRLADEGVDCIKVYNEIGSRAFQAIAAAARRHGLPLIGHVPHAVGLAGVSDFESQHMTGIPYLTRPRPPAGWDIRDEDVLAMTDEEIEQAFDIALRQHISFTPTLANFSLRLTASDPQRFPATPASRLLPRYWADAWNLIAGHPSTEEDIALRLRMVPAMRALVRRAHARGIDILAGTDTIMPWVVPGESLHLEMEELRGALGSSESALAAATIVNGDHIDPGEIGVIRAGARADLLLMSSDPTQALGALRDWRILFVDGRRYDRPTIDSWVESYREHFRGGLHAALMDTIVSAATEHFEHANRDAMATTPVVPKH
jgi:hypothetical protein